MGNLQSLSELYQNKLFRIPDYQRGYAWKKDQLIDFWDDIINLQQERYHYTGLLSLKAVPKSESKMWGNDKWLIDSGYKAYHVVDGQQRLTTFSILINEIVSFVKNMDCNVGKDEDKIVLCYQTLESIRNKYISKKRPPQNLITTYLFGYEIDNPSADYLVYKIYEEPYSGAINETYYTQNLKYAKKFFANCLDKLYSTQGLEGIESIFRKLTLQLMFNIHEIEDDYDVFVAFETMNNRGKKLTNLELLKNRLIYLTTLYDDNKLDEMDKTELRKQINDSWKEIYYQLGRNQNHPLNDDEFLRAHWIIYFQYSRKKGNDYIDFLLNKFSAKNIFAKQAIDIEEEVSQAIDEYIGDDDIVQPIDEDSFIKISKLEPHEISEYVKSLKEVAKYWFYTYFPEESDLTYEEKIWIKRLNRIGIGYFRPVITATLAVGNNYEIYDRIELFKAIERFIFLGFRMGGFQSSYKSSEYYRQTRRIYIGELDIKEVTKSLIDTINRQLDYVINNFKIRIDKRFSNGEGFYGWRELKYLLYEYEFEKASETGIEKLGWSPFTKIEKDKVTIEHILPQTPSKWYWRNQFRNYSKDEIRVLSSTLGNLLPLSQSVNSSLQNDSFEDKKNPNKSGRRGYIDGSHSELEVSHESDWDGRRILERGLKLLKFIEDRWDMKFKDEKQKIELLNLEFMKEHREEIDEIPNDDDILPCKSGVANVETSNGLCDVQFVFWTSFVQYCREKGRGDDIAFRNPVPKNFYDVLIGKSDYYIFFTVGKQILRIGIYIYEIEDFLRLESKKNEIEDLYGDSLEWYTSRKNSKAKRVLNSKIVDLYNIDSYEECFDWMIEKFDKLKYALSISDGDR